MRHPGSNRAPRPETEPPPTETEPMRRPRPFAAAAILASAVLVTGCTAASEDTATSTASATAVPTGAEGLLDRYDLTGKDAVEIVDRLDRLGGSDRPADLMASVRPDELVISGGGEELALDVPEDRFYLSVAPYVNQTHECFYHSLTTCTGELASTEVQVEIVDATNGRVLVDETRTTFANGFVGFWLPRGIEGTLRVTYDGKTGETPISTRDDAPTCLTTLRLA